MSLIVRDADKLAIQQLTMDSHLLRASQLAEGMPTVVTITSDEEAEALSDYRMIFKQGVKVIKDGLTALFAPGKAVEKVVRAHFNAPSQVFEQRVYEIDRALSSWMEQKRRYAAEMQRAVDEAAAEAAAAVKRDYEAAAAAIAEAADAPPGEDGEAASIDPGALVIDEPPPGESQIIVPPAQTTTKSARSMVYETTRVAATVECLGEAASNYPDAFEFKPSSAIAAFKELVKNGAAKKPTAEGEEIGGIRFYLESSVAGGKRR